MPLPDDLRSLNLSVALARVDGDVELLREIALIFLEQYPDSLAEVRAAVEAADASAIERSAHALKGSVGNFGAETARAAAYRIEEMGRSGDLDGVGPALEELDTALNALAPDLKRLISS